jgi:hypothetical protein
MSRTKDGPYLLVWVGRKPLVVLLFAVYNNKSTPPEVLYCNVYWIDVEVGKDDFRIELAL